MKKLGLFSVLALAACGTLFSGTDQDVSFDSNVKGVKIYVDGMEVCRTPCVFPLERKSASSVIMAKKDGYDDKQIVLRSNLNKVAILNLTFWPSWLTDVATGGMWQYSSDGVYVDMEKAGVKKAELEQIKRKVATRRFVLFNYGELKIEAAGKEGEYIAALSELSGLSKEMLTEKINNNVGPVYLAHALTM